jgi:carbon storage regulator
MLVLTRKRAERIVLPEQGIVIQVLEIYGNRVRLGITAPAEVAVHRQEVWERKRSRPVKATRAAESL